MRVFSLAALLLFAATGAAAQDCQRARRSYEVARDSMRPDQTMVTRAWREMQATCGGTSMLSPPRSTTIGSGVVQVKVRRIDKDLYRTDTDHYIQTRNCFQLADGDHALLRYESYRFDNTLIFRDRGTCEVLKVFK